MFLNFLTPFPHQVKIIDKTKILGIFKSSPQPKVFLYFASQGKLGRVEFTLPCMQSMNAVLAQPCSVLTFF